MLKIKANSANELFNKLSFFFNEDMKESWNNEYVDFFQDEIEDYYETAPRGQKIRERLNVNVELTNIFDNIVYNPARRISPRYLAAEFIWYLSGSRNAEYISNYAPFWKQLQDHKGNINSNYGYYCFREKLDYFSPEGRLCSQFDFVIDSLIKDKDTRQAVININNVSHKVHDNKDFPCTTAIQYFIRNNKLYTQVNMRSCDLILGFCNDIFQFTYLTLLLHYKLQRKGLVDLELGSLYMNFGSLHVYERHFEMIKNVEENRLTNLEFITNDHLFNIKYEFGDDNLGLQYLFKLNDKSLYAHYFNHRISEILAYMIIENKFDIFYKEVE